MKGARPTLQITRLSSKGGTAGWMVVQEGGVREGKVVVMLYSDRNQANAMLRLYSDSSNWVTVLG